MNRFHIALTMALLFAAPLTAGAQTRPVLERYGTGAEELLRAELAIRSRQAATTRPAVLGPTTGPASLPKPQATLKLLKSGLNLDLAGRKALQNNVRIASLSTDELITKLVAIEKANYGADNRRDIHEVSDSAVRTRARSVAAMCLDNQLTRRADGEFMIPTTPLGETRNMCHGQRFTEQPVFAYGTAFLVAPDLMVTAGHCVPMDETIPSDRIRIVFDYAITGPGFMPRSVSADNVYSVAKVIDRIYTANGADWAVIKLDRPVTGRAPLDVRGSAVRCREAVSVMGHPSGLPMKFADDAEIRSNTKKAYFVANLDTFGGNSGSPVFDKDGRVVGVLVRGGVDYYLNVDRGCHIASGYPATGRQGEACTRMSELFPILLSQGVAIRE